MSRHQAVRNLDYQRALDEFDEGYSDEEELSPEDQALMRQSTANVKASLGVAASKVTTTQIEEALWHYYYDVDKAVTYLVTKFISPPEPKTPKATPTRTSGKQIFHFCFESLRIPSWSVSDACPRRKERMAKREPRYIHPDPFIRATRASLTRRQGVEFPRLQPTPPRLQESCAYHFRDMPWGNIPKHRETIFIEPPHLRGGLLGGSGAPPKLSKLQQLAAARKKKAEEKKTQEKVEGVRTKLGELGLSSALGKKENTPLGGPNKRLKMADSNSAVPAPLADRRLEGSQDSDPMQVDGADDRATESDQQEPADKEEAMPAVEPAKPSAFAQVLFGNTSDTPARQQQETFTLPFATHPAVLAAFSGPSPDDIVLTAQAKGSLSGKGNN